MCHPPIFTSKSPVYKPKKLSQTQIILYRSERNVEEKSAHFHIEQFLMEPSPNQSSKE